MSNFINVEPTEFKNVRDGTVSFGVRIYDDHGQSYINSWESIPDDDLEVLEMAIQDADDIASSIFDFIQEEEKTVYVSGIAYRWNEIKHLFT